MRGTAPTDSASPGSLTLDGLLLDGAVDVAAGHLGALHLSHCTLAPGTTAVSIGANRELHLSVDHSITGELTPGDAIPHVTIVDSIVDGALAGRAVTVVAATIFGTTTAETIEATDSIFTDAVTIERRQIGCVRFSYLAADSMSPRRYRCAPAEGVTLRPAFVSTSFGHAAYAVLAPGCPDAIARGAEDGSEMGAWHHLDVPQRLDNLRRTLDEYLRFGLEAGSAFAPQ